MVDVSIICPTYHRHMYIPLLLEQFKKQDYDGKMELIIFDDSEDPYPFDDITKDIRVIYKHDNSKQYMLWEKRNILNEMCKGEIIICMDDDDIFFHDRVSYSVKELKTHEKFMIMGNSSIYIYDLLTSELHLFKSKSKSNILNGTFAYKKEILKTNSYKRTKLNSNEERSFTKNYSTPYKLLDYNNTTICVSHSSNTVPKAKYCSNIYTKNINSLIPQQILDKFYEVNSMIFWINMEHSLDRKNSMLKQLDTFKFHKRIIGISEPSFSYNEKISSKSEAACLNSHIIALKESVKSSFYNYSIICEDDINLGDIKFFNERIFYYIRSAPDDWEILQLFNINLKLLDLKIVKNDSMLKWNKWKPEYYSTMIYIIKKSIANKIINKFESFNFKKQKCIADDFIYRYVKTYSINLPFFTEKIELESEIHINHMPMHIKYNECIEKHHSNIKFKYPF